jgi:hypothetical protein
MTWNTPQVCRIAPVSTRGEIRLHPAGRRSGIVFTCIPIDRIQTGDELNSPLAKGLALFAGVHLLGGHWLALQMVAWMGMFAVNSQQGDLGSALEKTFDGKHPCPLCAAVDAGQKKEKEQQQKQLVDTVNKVNAVLIVSFELPRRTESALDYTVFSESAEALSSRPPSPPPWRV